MIDMHSHILPGIDDGARDLDEALALLRLAEADGVTTQVLTPHIHPIRYDNTLASIRRACERLAQEVRQAGLTIQLEFAAEIRISPEIVSLVEAEQVPWLGVWQGRRLLLVEFPYNSIPVGSLNLVEWLLRRDIVPMLAHPERIFPIQRDIGKLLPFLQAGCLTQITAGSLLGDFGAAARDVALRLLENGQVSLVASDCHNLSYRPPKLRAGIDVAARVIGPQASQDMVTTVPRQMRAALAAQV